MMIDNDMPKALGFLQSYSKGLSQYQQEGEGIPDFSVQNQYAQELGGPLVSRTIQYSPPNAILKTPHIDSPYMDQLIQRGFKPLKPPGPKGPQLPSFL
jgi:hypothetical protein